MEIVTALGTEIALSALSPVINKLGTYFGGDVTPAEMKHLQLFVRSKISVLIEEAKSDDLDLWKKLLEELQETALEVDDLLDLYEYNQIKNQVSSSSTNPIKKFISISKEKLTCILPKSSLRVKLEKLLNFVDQVEKHPFIKLDKTKEYKSPEATASTLSSTYFGRHKQYESLVKLLLDDQSDRRINEVPVIAIQGLGGSGKTLTAQRVCNDERITNYFDEPLMWVHVTSDFDVERITKEMIESLEKKGSPQSTFLDVLHTSLKESLKKRKRFLLVLDDVWCEDKIVWDKLVGPLNEAGGKGSKIIITTRLEHVARPLAGKENVVSLDELEAEDCWSILKYYAFNNPDHVIEDQGLVNVGNQIISKARSSPLALKVVGSSLRDITSVDEWEKILDRDVLKGTMDLLSSSFQRLSLHLQRCFVYCSLFPKGYIHEEHVLVPLWIAQGYIEKKTDKLTLEKVGSIYISDLLSYSFFEKKNSSDYRFVIHDLLHDLAEKASSELCHRIEHFDSLMDIPKKCIHLSMYTTVEFGSIDISDISKLKKLRSLIILDDASCTNIFRENTAIFQNLSKLRALHVKSDQKMEVLSNLHTDQLKHLRYLHFYYDKKLPESLTKLYHLQFFNLRVGSDLSEYSDGHRWLKPNTLPQGFGNLINLRTLKFFYNNSEVDYLKHNSEVISIEKLESLQNVIAFHPEKDNVNGMVALKNIALCGSLRICDLENVKSKGDAEKAMLKQKKNLNELILQWGSTAGGRDDIEACEEVLEGFEPHEKLKSLKIRGYQGVKVAKWMVRKSPPMRLQSLTLSKCKNIREINFRPPAIQSPTLSIQSLTLSHCKSIREISFLPSGLQNLYVRHCDELKQLPHFGSSSTLKKLQLIDCPVLRLQSMPNNSTSLGRLNVRRCPMLMTDEPLLVGDTAKCFSQVERFKTDEPLLVLVLVQQQAFCSIKRLDFMQKAKKPFPRLLEDHFHEFSFLRELYLDGFKTLPDLEKLSSLVELHITNCPDVKLLPYLPVSLKRIDIVNSTKLWMKYKEDGPLQETISHIPKVNFKKS